MPCWPPPSTTMRAVGNLARVLSAPAYGVAASLRDWSMRIGGSRHGPRTLTGSPPWTGQKGHGALNQAFGPVRNQAPRYTAVVERRQVLPPRRPHEARQWVARTP